jgi:hypothetical protein
MLGGSSTDYSDSTTYKVAHKVTNVAGFITGGAPLLKTSIGKSSMLFQYGRHEGKDIVLVSSSNIKFSQSSVNNWRELTESMRRNGWHGNPIDIVKMKDGTFITLDNTRVLAAHDAGINVKAVIRNFDEALTDTILLERFYSPKVGYPSTWGQAVEFRINKQSASYKISNVNGSNVISRGLNND